MGLEKQICWLALVVTDKAGQNEAWLLHSWTLHDERIDLCACKCVLFRYRGNDDEDGLEAIGAATPSTGSRSNAFSFVVSKSRVPSLVLED